MKVHEAIQTQVGELVAADDDEGLVAEKLLDLLQPAGAAEQLVFVRIVQLHAETRPITQRFNDAIRQVVHVDRDLVEAVRLEIAHQMRGVGNAGDRNERFGNELGKRIEPRREAAREDHRFHEFAARFSAGRKPSASSEISQTKRGSASWRRQRDGSLTSR